MPEKSPKKKAQKKDSNITQSESKPKPNNSQSTEAFIKNKKIINIIELQKSNMKELYSLAETSGIIGFNQLRRNDLIFKILQKQTDNNTLIYARGCLEILPEGYGFLRTNNYLPSTEDIYVSQTQIKRFGLMDGDTISGYLRTPKEGERFFSLLRVESINWQNSDMIKSRTLFSNLTPIYPHKKILLAQGQKPISGRMLDLLVPIGKGQRALIVSPPKAGKTSMMKEIANAISENHPEIMIKVLLIDERPEEVTDMERSIDGEVIYSTFDEPPEQHVKISELVLKSAKRLVESGKDVLILLDSITRLARAYNLVVPPSGRTLTGGLDPSSLHGPKRFFGGARAIENGGSLTIIATALVDTGSRMDDIIFEEFKGTGNMELQLKRALANKRIFPAIDILNSGTRKEELLLSEADLEKSILLRRHMDNENATEELIKLLAQYKNNAEFLSSPIFNRP